jgi:hypothetical protein
MDDPGRTSSRESRSRKGASWGGQVENRKIVSGISNVVFTVSIFPYLWETSQTMI